MSEKSEERQAFEVIAGFVNALRNINEIAATEYRVLVEDVISGRITEESKIEKVMDGLLNFCDSPECLELFKRLSGYTLYKYPEMTVDYINLYRELFGEQAEGGEK